MQKKYFTVPMGIVTAMLMLALYWPGLGGGFFFDDGPSILLPGGVRLESFTLESIRQAMASGGAGPSGRPVAQLSFALNYYLSGFSPFAFKATNLAIHLACGWLVFALAVRLLRGKDSLAGAQHTSSIAAGAAALLWLFHPIQLLPILHVVQRMTSLSAIFLLTALLLHIRGREAPSRPAMLTLILAWLVFWPLSFLSKESGALFPLFVLAWELTLRRSAHGGLDRFARILAALSALVLIAAAVYALSPRGQWLWAGYDHRGFSLPERVLTEGRVLWIYLGLILLPRLSAFALYHDDIALSTDLFTPWTTLPALLMLGGLLWLVWRLRKRAPLVAFGIAWFLIGHALESTVLPLEIAHEHRNYLPLFGPVMIAAWALAKALERGGGFKMTGVVLAAATVASIAVLTALRAYPYGDELIRTMIEVENHPASARAQNEAASALGNLPQAAIARSSIYKLARHHHEQALALDPGFKISGLGLIYLNCKAGLPPEQAEVEELRRRLRETPFAPGDQTVLYKAKEMAIAGTLCLRRHELDGLFGAALTNPVVTARVRAILHSWQADYLWLRERDVAAARAALGQSLSLNPANLSNRLKWAQLLLISGEQAKAAQLLLELKDENFSTEERNTINGLLAALKIG